MGDGSNDDEAAGAAIAALALAQMMFCQLLQEGAIDKKGSVEMLKRAIEINGNKDRAHSIAAAMLTNLLHVVEAYRAPQSQSSELAMEWNQQLQ
jgi:hypothetical protein